MRTVIGILLAGATIYACADSVVDVSTTTVARPTSTVSDTTNPPLVVGCPADEVFVESGVVDEFENPGSDSATIGLISWEAGGACETFQIEFESTEGAPATTPPSVSAEFVGDAGVLRVSTSAGETVITDQKVETDLVERLYVVRGLDGGTFIDFHLTGAAQARIDLDNSPARLTVELQPGIVDHASRPTIEERIVLVSPGDESPVPLSLNVNGYIRDLESDLLLIATQGNEVLDEVVAATAPSSVTWGEFRGTLELVPGQMDLFIGVEESESGRFEGISIDLQAG